MSVSSVRVEITREELITLAISKAEGSGIEISQALERHPEIRSREVVIPGTRVRPVWPDYSEDPEGQAEAFAGGDDLAWVEITIYPIKID